MKAVILAAGLGSRLRPITNDVPKCMVPVNGHCIIDKQIQNLLENGFKDSDIIVVAGYLSNILIDHLQRLYPNINIIDNKRYAETNNMYSFYQTMSFVKGEDFLLMNSDVFYDANIIEGLVKSDAPSMIACDCSCYMEESMKITLDGDKINHISKKITDVEYYGVSIDVYKISKESGDVLFKEVIDTIENHKDMNSWTEVALDHIFDKTTFVPYVIEGRWFEIDNHEDLVKAEQIFAK